MVESNVLVRDLIALLYTMASIEPVMKIVGIKLRVLEKLQFWHTNPWAISHTSDGRYLSFVNRAKSWIT